MKRARESRRAAKAEKAERKSRAQMVRRTCKQCGHEWVMPRAMAKAGKRLGQGAILGRDPSALIAFGGKIVEMDSCQSCGSVRYFDEAPLDEP